MEFGTDIHGSQRMNLNYSGDPLTSLLHLSCQMYQNLQNGFRYFAQKFMALR